MLKRCRRGHVSAFVGGTKGARLRRFRWRPRGRAAAAMATEPPPSGAAVCLRVRGSLFRRSPHSDLAGPRKQIREEKKQQARRGNNAGVNRDDDKWPR